MRMTDAPCDSGFLNKTCRNLGRLTRYSIMGIRASVSTWTSSSVIILLWIFNSKTRSTLLHCSRFWTSPASLSLRIIVSTKIWLTSTRQRKTIKWNSTWQMGHMESSSCHRSRHERQNRPLHSLLHPPYDRPSIVVTVLHVKHSFRGSVFVVWTENSSSVSDSMLTRNSLVGCSTRKWLIRFISTSFLPFLQWILWMNTRMMSSVIWKVWWIVYHARFHIYLPL